MQVREKISDMVIRGPFTGLPAGATAAETTMVEFRTSGDSYSEFGITCPQPSGLFIRVELPFRARICLDLSVLSNRHMRVVVNSRCLYGFSITGRLARFTSGWSGGRAPLPAVAYDPLLVNGLRHRAAGALPNGFSHRTPPWPGYERVDFGAEPR